MYFLHNSSETYLLMQCHCLRLNTRKNYVSSAVVSEKIQCLLIKELFVL